MNGPEGPSAADVQAAFCTTLVDEWVRAGLTDALVSPGSRSTPLVLALDADPAVRVHVVLDERSAGFTALGMALATRRPVVVATTSGTASVELHPAVVEAFHAGVPMIVATSDRPPELHDVGAPQTVAQDSLFLGALRWAISAGVPEAAASSAWRSLASRVHAEARGWSGRPGPVHLNLPFREPLLGDAERGAVPAGRPGRAPWHDAISSRTGTASPDGIVQLVRQYAGAKGLVVAGRGSAGHSGLVEAAEVLGWPVLADPRSGLRTGGGVVVGAADPLLRVGRIAEGWIPEIVVRAGAPWASKVLSQWLARLDPSIPQVIMDPSSAWLEPERRGTHIVPAEAGAVLAEAASGLRPETDEPSSRWVRQWVDAERAAQEVLDRLLSAEGELSMSEPAVARALLREAVPGTKVVVSSSMPVRDAEWFGPTAVAAEVFSNRGANGIDGVVSTAMGVALSGAPTAALLGDLAFLYDANALVGLSARDVSLRMIVIDNDGGGIFSFLPQASALPPDRFERYWGTPHATDLVSVATGFGVGATPIESRASLDEFIAGIGKPGAAVAVVPSDRTSNVEIHERLNAEIGRAVSGI